MRENKVANLFEGAFINLFFRRKLFKKYKYDICQS